MSFLYFNGMILQNWNMGQDVRRKIANKVKQLRLQKGLKKEELSLMLNFDNSYISKLELCKVNIPIDKLEIIADFFDVKVVDFFN